jgi:hypothetical protein
MSCSDCAIILVLGVDLNKIPFTDEMRIQQVFCLDYGPNISFSKFPSGNCKLQFSGANCISHMD